MEETVESTEEDFRKRLNPFERADLTSTLDHLVASGAKWAYTAERLEAWKNNTRPEDEKKSHLEERRENRRALERVVVAPPPERSEAWKDNLTHPENAEQLHMEDQRMYELRCGLDNKRNKKVHPNNREWEIEHGDTIHPIAFLNARLSSKRRRCTDDVDGANLSVDTTVGDVSTLDAPRALLNHCWQRAVHAASNPIHVDDDEPPTQPESNENNDEEKYSVKKAKVKCVKLNLDLPHDKQICISCETEFDTREQLNRHFYGASNQRGCCWVLIDERNHELIDQALQAEVMQVTKQVCQILAKRVFQDGTAQQTLNWKDVVGIISSTMVHQSKRGETDTIQPDNTQLPIALNPDVMETIYRRLVDRYSGLPK
jgi:hypothetical protein